MQFYAYREFSDGPWSMTDDYSHVANNQSMVYFSGTDAESKCREFVASQNSGRNTD
jgi:hypothetical protein